ncbi:MAG: hemolysin family protein [Treponema sp.]|nr:hemolysin family protein [Treponema sp.]
MDTLNQTGYYITVTAALIVLFCLSVFFALCETSFSSANRIKLKNMADKGKPKRRAKRARLVLKLLDEYDKLLSSVLIGNTIVNVVTSALATVLCIRLFGSKGVSIAAAIVTVTVLIFAEISPKTLAKEVPELTAFRTAPLLRFFMLIFTPFNYLASAWKKVIIKIFPVKTDRTVTEDELLTFVKEVRQEGGINRHEEHMIRQVIEFDDMTAAEIITPRIDLTAIPENASAEEINNVFAETRFSRLPVYRETIDNITGVILFKDFHYEVFIQGKPPSEIIKPVLFVTKTIKIRKLLRTLQEKQAHMAVLVDEFGGTLGVVTIEDIIEELVGEIWDEHDEVEEEFIRNEDGILTVLGSANLHDMFDVIANTFSITLPEETASLQNTTVGNWVSETYGSLPRSGDRFEWHNLQITVSRVQRHRVMEVQIKN